MKDSLDREQANYEHEVREVAARLIRDEGLPKFDALDRAQRIVAVERKRRARLLKIAELASAFSKGRSA
jgi:hypothetical protein